MDSTPVKELYKLLIETRENSRRRNNVECREQYWRQRFESWSDEYWTASSFWKA